MKDQVLVSSLVIGILGSVMTIGGFIQIMTADKFGWEQQNQGVTNALWGMVITAGTAVPLKLVTD